MSIIIKEQEFRDAISNLDKEIANLERIYSEIENKSKKLDGNDEMWKSDTQKAIYDYYISVSKDFPSNIERLKSLRSYLNTTLDNYIEEESGINNDVDTNIDNLSINE